MKMDVPQLPHAERYKVQKRLGRDDAGELWLAYDTRAQQPVLLKFYRLDRSSTSEALTRYVRTMKQVASLHHANIVRIHDVQILAPQSASYPFSQACVVTDYVEGETLASSIKRTSAVGNVPSSAEIVRLFSYLALIIDKVHQNGIIHGNLKPEAILLKQDTPDGVRTPLITEFAATSLLPGSQRSLSFYLAPEQLKGGPPDKRSDIYALGVLLYEIYTGKTPFRGNRSIGTLMQSEMLHSNGSSALMYVVLRCLTNDPRGRFPSATALAIAIAEALQVPVPEELRQSSSSIESDAPKSSTARNAAKVMPKSQASNGVAPTPLPPLKRRRTSNALFIAMGAIALVVIFGASFGAWFLLTQKSTFISTYGTGHAFFVNSGQLNENTTQGINDELQIDISTIPDPAAGKSYYAWLLGDVVQSELSPMFLGRLTVEHGAVHFLYPGNSRHDNLLATASRFLITEDDTQNPAGDPLLNQSNWRYYAVLPQVSNKTDPLHFSLLDHLRHLLVEAPELAARGLHGGLSFWFARDTALVSDVANRLADDWQKKDTRTIHNQVIRILDYLDGSSFVKTDLPPGTPWLADTQNAQVPLLGPTQDTDPPGYVFQDEAPPGYVYLVRAHLNGAVLSPQASPAQHALAVQIGKGIDDGRQALVRAYQDAKQLLGMSAAQLQGSSALNLLDDLATQAQLAYTGQVNPSTGVSQGGAIWIYTNLQRLVAFDVTPYATQ